MAAKKAVSAEAADKPKSRGRLSQMDVPAFTVVEALKVPAALRDEYGKKATRPLMVAKALGVKPASSNFRVLTGSALAYGLTDAGAQSDLIGLTPLGTRAVSPTIEGDDRVAISEAVLRPRVIREFLERYSGSKVPSKTIALNVLEDMGVPKDATDRAFDMILANARTAGFLTDVGGQDYVDLGASPPASPAEDPHDELDGEEGERLTPPPSPPSSPDQPINDLRSNKRVFITHGKDKSVVDQLKEVLTFGGFEPIVSVDNQSVAKPVPDKVMDDMRSCGAGIVHVGAERTLMDEAGEQHKVLNPNVLIEIGAALALYKRNFILLVERGVEMPSNLQGLYEVRYDGGKLDYDATMKLLKAFNEFKSS